MHPFGNDLLIGFPINRSLRFLSPYLSFYGVVVCFFTDCRDSNGFVFSGYFPCGDEGLRIILRLPEECEEDCRNDKISEV